MSDRRSDAGALRPTLIVAALAAFAFIAACAIPGQAVSPTPTPRPDTAALVRQLMQCVRSHGNPDFPDPSIGQDGIPRWPSDTQPPSQEAQRACGSIYDRLPKPAASSAPTAADLALARQFAACMRQNGLAHWPDPNPDGSFTLPPEYQQKTPQLLTAWREHCARYNPSGHIEVHR
jgi:hypothetical protein